MWELDDKEGWVPKNWCFWTMGLEKTLECPLDSKRIKPISLKGLKLEYSLEGLMLKLKLQYFDHLLWRVNSPEKTLMLGKIEGKREGNRGWDGWMASLTQWTWVEENSVESKQPGSLVCCSPWGHKELDMTEQQHRCSSQVNNLWVRA